MGRFSQMSICLNLIFLAIFFNYFKNLNKMGSNLKKKKNLPHGIFESLCFFKNFIYISLFPLYFLDLQIVILYWSQIQGSNFLAEIMIKQQSKKLSERKCNLKSLKV